MIIKINDLIIMSENNVNSAKKKKGERINKFSNKKTLQTYLIRMAPQIILYTRRISHTLKKKDSH